jgi:hypothetical protein
VARGGHAAGVLVHPTVTSQPLDARGHPAE